MCNFSERRRRHGEEGLDGRVFWSYCKGLRSGERWMSRQDFDRHTQNMRRRERENYKTSQAHRDKNHAKGRKRYSTNAEFREKFKSHMRTLGYLRYHGDPEVRSRKSETGRAWNKRARVERPDHVVKCRLRSRLRESLIKAQRAQKVSIRSKDPEAINFLLFAAVRQGIDVRDGKQHHIDHLIPVSRMVDLSKINVPENVRWLSAAENLRKHNTMPSQAEIEAHLALVAEWRATLVK